MTVTFNTNRLTLRDLEPGDLDALFELYRRPETSEFESWTAHTSRAESKALLEYWLAEQSAENRQEYLTAICSNEQFIGLCGLTLGFGTETDDPRSAFLGYRLHPDAWHKGFATEAASGLLRFAFTTLCLHRVHSGCSASHRASVRVLEKLAFRFEGTSRQSFPVDDDWHDYHHYGILAVDWRAQHKDE